MDKTRNDHDRDVQDVGRVLAALLRDVHADPGDIATKWTNADLTNIRCSTPIPVRIHNLIDLQLLDGARVLRGGGGIVFQCVNQEIPQLQYALKGHPAVAVQGLP